MHLAALNWVAENTGDSTPLRVLDIGGRDINGNPAHLFHPDSTWEVVDLVDGPRVTWVGNFLDYPAPIDLFDVVLCLEVAEHTEQWPEIIAAAAELLTDDGQLIFTAAGEGRSPHSASDGGELQPGEYYRNVGVDELEQVLAKSFGTFIVDTLGPDIRAQAGDPL